MKKAERGGELSRYPATTRRE